MTSDGRWRTMRVCPQSRPAAELPAPGERARVPPIRQRPETVVQGVLLSCVGGFLDAFTFVRFGVFANAQTGNVVLLGIDAAKAEWRYASMRLVPIVVFVAAVMGVELLGKLAAHGRVRRPLRVALGIEVAGLLLVAVLPDRASPLAVTIIVTTVAAIQFATFRTLVDAPYSTLLASGNLRALAAGLHQRLIERDPTAGVKVARFGGVVGAFLVGATVGAVIASQFGNAAAAVPAALLLITLVILVLETRRIDRLRALTP